MSQSSSDATRDDEDPRKLLKSSLPGKSFIGFALALVAIIVVAIVSYRAQATRSELAQEVADTASFVRELDQTMLLVKDAETGQRGYLLVGEVRYLEPFNMASAMLDDQISRLRAAITTRPELRDELLELERDLRAKFTELRETVALRQAGRTDEAIALVQTDRGKQVMDDLRATAGKMNDAAQSQLASRTERWERLVETSTAITFFGSSVLLALVLIAGVMTSRDFREQQRQLWLRRSQGTLAASVAGEQSRPQLGDQIARLLARHVDASVVAVYATEKPDRLVRIGGYGLPAQELEAPAVTGLARQALRDGSIVRLDDVPADYVTVTSGLGGMRPRHIVLSPAIVDGRGQAVIELGLLRSPEPHELELLRRVAEPIAIALRTAKYREELRELLEETQRQAEELQTQQEELRVQNEELEERSRALQDSQARLENQQAELEQINAQLEEQTQTLEVQRDDLRGAQREAQRANTYKSEFLANMSHELRTPLNSSLILAKLLLDNREGNLSEEQVKFAQTIYSAGNDLLLLINDILDLSKIEAGKLDVRPEVVPIARLTDELVNTFTPVAKDRHLALEVVVDASAPATIHTDATRLLQILKNLMSNALKFTEQGGVSIAVRGAAGGIVFDVRDTGIGIAPEQHEIIFEAFRQADGTTNRKYGGTGLGLSISRDLASLLGGRLTLDSAPGRGSTFTLALPLEAPARPGGALPAEGTLAPSPARRPRAAAPPASTATRAEPAPSAPAGRSPAPPLDDRDRLAEGTRVILVIEDDLAFAKLLTELAREHEFQALLALTAEEGLALARQHRPSAIVLDVGLPDRSGLSVLDVLKRDPATRHIPVHMMSVTDYAQTALEMGAVGYALKPVKRQELETALHRLESKLKQEVRRVLVVEDDEVLRTSTCRLLAGDRVECVGVGTAADALAQLAATTFDTMVLDLSLPDKSGFALLEEMASKEQHAFPPVIVYTGRSLSREEEQRLRQFSQSIIIKGARSPERLLDEVTLFLHQVESELPPERQRMLRSARHREAVFEGRRILIVEDDARNIFALSSVLEPRGAKVEIARNGREALEHLRDHPGVDLVLMDIMMPEMDGLQAMRAIRAQPQLAKLPIIALTAKAMADDRDNCLAAGANDYVAKPLDVDKLLSLARVWMRS